MSDEHSQHIGKLAVPLKYVLDMLKYQRFQGNLTEKVGQELSLVYDPLKEVFTLNCNFDNIQINQIGEVFFQSIANTPYISKDSCFIQFGPNKTYHLL